MAAVLKSEMNSEWAGLTGRLGANLLFHLKASVQRNPHRCQIHGAIGRTG